MGLEGSLDAFSLSDIFQLLILTSKTGGLHLYRPGGAGSVHFTAGSVTAASSDDRRQTLARRLVGAGAVAEDALEAAVAAAGARPATSLVRALHDSGAVDPEALPGLLSEHVVDAVFDLLRWPDGDFSFLVGETSPDQLDGGVAADAVLAEARRRVESWSQLGALVPTPESVVSLSVVPPTDPVLSRDEWRLLALVDGRRPVRELVGLSGRGEYGVYAAVAALVERGLVVVGAADEGGGALLRRQRLLAGLEGPAVPAPEPPAAEPDVDTAETAEPDPDPDPDPADRDEPDPADPDEPDVDTAAWGQPASPTPERSYPSPVEAAPEGGAAAAVATLSRPVTVQPTLDRNAVLRLIAGVQGF